jgi:hypothetical protein
MTITARWLLVVDNFNSDCGIILVDGGTALKWGKVNISWHRFAWALMILSLLHHSIILIEACIGILDNESILKLDRGGSQKALARLVLLGRLLLLLCL